MDIFEEILKALDSEERVMLATIISTSGSTPAAAFSKMLVKNGGIISVGTVGGGCMEGDVILHANRLFEANRAEVLSFQLNEDDIEHGLICGGNLNVLIEPVTRSQIPLYRNLKSCRDDGTDRILVTHLSKEGRISDKTLIDPLNPQPATGIGRDVPEAVRQSYHKQETQRVSTGDGELILEPIAGTPELVIFGGGHVSRFVSRAASMVGFRVRIVDDREKYANPIRFPEAMETIVAEFADAFRRVTIKPSSYIVIVTRGHRFDEDLLHDAISTQAKYIGMIGSKRKVLATYGHLVERGDPPELLRRVHAPMGVDIGAVSPEEIGISIVAQLIRVRRGESSPLRDKSEGLFDLLPTSKSLHGKGQ